MSTKNKERECAYCKAPFVHKVWNQKYCSEKCQLRSRYKTYTCEVCGTVFESKHPNRRFCSNKCSAKVNIEPAETKQLKCSNCNKVFIRKKSRIRGSKVGNFCTRKCWDEYNSKMKAEKHHRWNSQKLTCEVCNTKILRQLNQLKRNDKNFCTHECYAKWLEENSVGENSPTWRGGSPDYRGGNWNKVKKMARERDGYRCQQCGEKEGKEALDVHHIVPYRFFNGDWRKANRLSNLISLCKRCHRKQESHWWQEVPEKFKQYM